MRPSSVKVASVDVSIRPGVLTLALLLIVLELTFIDSVVSVDDTTVTVSFVVFPLSFINLTSLFAEVDAIAIELLTAVGVTSKLILIIELTISNVVSRL